MTYKNTKAAGFGLIEVMVTVVITSIAALVMATLLQQAFIGQKAVTQNLSFRQVQGHVFNTLMQTEFCQFNQQTNLHPFLNNNNTRAKFPTTTAPSGKTSIDKIINTKTNSLIVAKGQEGPDFIIRDVVVQRQKNVNNQFIPPEINIPASGKTRHHVELYVEADRYGSETKKTPVIGGRLSSINQPIKFTLITDSATGQIANCGSASATKPAFCIVDDPCTLCTSKGKIRFSNGGGDCIASSIITNTDDSPLRWLQEFNAPGGGMTRLIIDITGNKLSVEVPKRADGVTPEYRPRLCHNQRQVAPEWGSPTKYGASNYCTCGFFNGIAYDSNCGNAIHWKSKELGNGSTKTHPNTAPFFGPDCGACAKIKIDDSNCVGCPKLTL